jgi:soluble lytic murein transglycosylase-like protein
LSEARARCPGAISIGRALGLVGAALVGSAALAGPALPFTTEAERCIKPAAAYHQVNDDLLRAVLRVESGLKPGVVGRNQNGTIDVGIAQINSIHFRELAGYGIKPEHLQDACVGTYVGAWQLARVIKRYGNTWEGVARYHSATPAFNQRYQTLLFNELVRAGAVRRSPAAGAPQAAVFRKSE